MMNILTAPHPAPSMLTNFNDFTFVDFIGKFGAREKIPPNELIDRETLEKLPPCMDKQAALRHKGPVIYKESR